MDLIQEYQNNLARIQTLHHEEEVLKKKKDKESNQISWDYRDKIYALEKERDEKVHIITTTFEKQNQDIDTETNKLREIHTKVERIINFLKIKPEEISCPDNNIKNFRGAVISLGILCSDDFMKLRAYIVESRKPVNRYSLDVYGDILFPESIIKPPRSYGLPGNTIKYQNIAIGIKDFPSVNQAKEYFEKNKAVLLHSCIRELVLQYKAIKAEYLQVLATYKLKDFKELFVIDCKACGFVSTKIGTSDYSITKGCCPSCDIDLKEARKIANASQRELPLLLGEIWKTTAAEDFYRKRMGELKQVA